MRLLGFLILCLFALTGLKIGYERRGEILQFASNQFNSVMEIQRAGFNTNTPQVTFEGRAMQQVAVSMRESGKLNTLVGMPSFARVHFDLPKSATATAGRLVLKVSGTLGENVDGVLRVSVNGVQRTAELLQTGPQRRDVAVQLNAAELSAQTLTVALSVDGNSNSQAGSCSAVGAVVKILPSSFVSLQLMQEITDPADKLLLAGSAARLAWPTWPALKRNDQAQVLATAFEISQRGTQVLFAPKGHTLPTLSVSDIKKLGAALPNRKEALKTDQADLASALGQRRTKEFASKARWRMPFDAQALQGQAQAVDLALTYTSAFASDLPWLIAVYLNDRLIYGDVADANSGQIQARVALPQGSVARDNVLSVTFRNGAPTSDLCGVGAPTVAELTTARLVTVASNTPTPMAALAPVLEKGVGLHVPAVLTADAGQAALDTFAALQKFGIDVSIEGAAVTNMDQPHVKVIRQGNIPAFLAARRAQSGPAVWIAYQNNDDDKSLMMAPLDAHFEIAPENMPKAILVISDKLKGDQS